MKNSRQKNQPESKDLTMAKLEFMNKKERIKNVSETKQQMSSLRWARCCHVGMVFTGFQRTPVVAGPKFVASFGLLALWRALPSEGYLPDLSNVAIGEPFFTPSLATC